MGGKLRRRLGGKGVIEAVIDFVGDEADAEILRRRDESGKRVLAHHGAGRIGRARHQQAVQRLARMRRAQGLRRDRPARFFAGLDQHRLAAERGEDVAIRRIAGIGQRDAIARLEQREERQHKSARRAGGDDDARRIDLHGISVRIMPRDARAQSGNAERLGIGDRAGQSRARRIARRLWRRRRRLADLHMHDLAACRLQTRGGGHHVHDHERRHVAARRRREQALGAIEHRGPRDRPIDRLAGSAPLLPHSRGLFATFPQRCERSLR